MKKLILTITLLAGLLPLSSFANVADNPCSINGTNISFDLSSSTPWTDGSRFFAGIAFWNGTIDSNATPFLTIGQGSMPAPQYVVEYADGVLDSGAPYFRILITDRNTNAQFYAFSSNGASADTPVTSTVWSNLPGLDLPQSGNYTLNCQ